VTRKRISWLGATLLSLYHLHITEAPSNLGFYHWRTDVARLIATHWSDIFGPAVKKKKTWQGSVSGSLSGNASTLFESGLCTTGEQGWWRLRSLDSPASQLSRLAPKVVASRQTKPVEGVQEVLGRRGDRGNCSSLALAIARKEARDGLVAIPKANKKEKVKKKRGEKRRLLEENLNIEYAEEEEEEIKERYQICENYEEDKSVRFDSDGRYENLSTTSLLKVSRVNNLLVPGPSRSPSISSSSVNSCPSLETAAVPTSSPQESPFLPPDPSPVSPSLNSPSVSSLLDDDSASIDEMGDAAIDEDVIGSLVVEEEGGNLLSELFQNQDVTDPAIVETVKRSQDIDNENIETNEMPSNVSSPGANNTTSCANDIHQDFSEEERSQHFPEDQTQDQLLESDTCKNPSVPSMNRSHKPGPSSGSRTEDDNDAQVLDRFQHQGSFDHPCQSLVVETAITDWSISPFSGARLSPYIRRDTETEPPGLAVLRKFDSFATRLHPIDFCYLQPQLVPAVNCLAEKLFWPGIDLGEGLLFPDFSCVALYKRLCVGFGLVVPDCRWSESYLSHLAVHPAWRGNGLATFMLYHLIQTNLGKDLTLHVSASNPALLLYQKFGFKVEEFVSNFYTRYLPPDSQQSPHALFLRLAR